MDDSSKIFVAGHTGLVGSAITEKLRRCGYRNLILKSSKELDLRDMHQVQCFFKRERPEYVFLAAGRVGGIGANISDPAPFLYENVMIQMNVIHQAYLNGVKKILILGSSCIYPVEAPQPLKEKYLLSGRLEPTNEGYALSKIVALKQAEYYKKQYGFNAIAIMPCNLYGLNDSFDLKRSHVLSATVKKFVDAVDDSLPSVTMWGTGAARREFMDVEDLSAACLFMMQNYDGDTFVNVGWGEDISIKDLAEKVALLTGFKGAILWDHTKPDGMLRKCLDVSKMKQIGFTPVIRLEEGILNIIKQYKKLK